MPKVPKAALFACLLSACTTSKPIAVPYSRPQPPAQALIPCLVTALVKTAEGALTSAGAEGAIRDGDAALAECDAKRRLLIESWPK